MEGGLECPWNVDVDVPEGERIEVGGIPGVGDDDEEMDVGAGVGVILDAIRQYESKSSTKPLISLKTEPNDQRKESHPPETNHKN